MKYSSVIGLFRGPTFLQRWRLYWNARCSSNRTSACTQFSTYEPCILKSSHSMVNLNFRTTVKTVWAVIFLIGWSFVKQERKIHRRNLIFVFHIRKKWCQSKLWGILQTTTPGTQNQLVFQLASFFTLKSFYSFLNGFRFIYFHLLLSVMSNFDCCFNYKTLKVCRHFTLGFERFKYSVNIPILHIKKTS